MARKKISERNKLALWTRGGGRCYYCNCLLLGDVVSGKEKLNKAYIAHIVAAEPDGPRGDAVLSSLLVDDIENLILMCDPHHRLIDRDAVLEYPVSRLKNLKLTHEARIEAVTEIAQDRGTHLLFYAARIGEHDCLIQNSDARAAVLPTRYPLERNPIALDVPRCDFVDYEDAYWKFQIDNLNRQFDRKIRSQIADGHLKHLSVFGLAPQPLLIELGRLLSDIPDVSVHQLHREQKGWHWRDDRPAVEFTMQAGNQTGNLVALKIGISAQITDDRIRRVLGNQVSIWSIEAIGANNDIMHSESDLATFRQISRQTLDAIKATHPHISEIHVFPAMPVSSSIELGRIWMPKADLALRIYDENRAVGGFVLRHSIGIPAGIEKAEMRHA